MTIEKYYFKEYHEELPHIVKFSGGRSSGALLFNMLENEMLKAQRGDVVVFNNTSAEHPKTYEFVKKCKKKCEEEYGIPFFLTEFQTFEDSRNGIYDRFQSYRLVNDEPYSINNPNGYHYKGEIFEELISWQGYLPNLMSGRTCTKKMKMDVTYSFLKDWFSGLQDIERLGHYGSSTRIKIENIYQKHEKNGGSVPIAIFREKKEYCLSRPLFRPNQKFSDYTNVPICNSSINSQENKIEFCSFIGFRYDEPHRIKKMKERIGKESNDNIDMAYLQENQEHIYAPLVDAKVTQEDIKYFWDAREFDLGLPYDGSLGNCVFCFMKGITKLKNITSTSKDDTPQNIDWWIYIEKKYQRDLIAEERRITTNTKNPYINFFGVNGKVSYQKIKDDNTENIENELMPCNCTD